MNKTDVIPALIAPYSLEEEINIKHKITLNYKLWFRLHRNKTGWRMCVSQQGLCLSGLWEKGLNSYKHHRIQLRGIGYVNCDEGFQSLRNSIHNAKFNRDFRFLKTKWGRNHIEGEWTSL